MVDRFMEFGVVSRLFQRGLIERRSRYVQGNRYFLVNEKSAGESDETMLSAVLYAMAVDEESAALVTPKLSSVDVYKELTSDPRRVVLYGSGLNREDISPDYLEVLRGDAFMDAGIEMENGSIYEYSDESENGGAFDGCILFVSGGRRYCLTFYCVD